MRALIIVVVFFALIAIAPALLMVCWNLALVPLFPAIPEIGFWTALAIVIICNILFGRK